MYCCALAPHAPGMPLHVPEPCLIRSATATHSCPVSRGQTRTVLPHFPKVRAGMCRNRDWFGVQAAMASVKNLDDIVSPSSMSAPSCEPRPAGLLARCPAASDVLQLTEPSRHPGKSCTKVASWPNRCSSRWRAARRGTQGLVQAGEMTADRLAWFRISFERCLAVREEARSRQARKHSAMISGRL